MAECLYGKNSEGQTEVVAIFKNEGYAESLAEQIRRRGFQIESGKCDWPEGADELMDGVSK